MTTSTLPEPHRSRAIARNRARRLARAIDGYRRGRAYALRYPDRLDTFAGRPA